MSGFVERWGLGFLTVAFYVALLAGFWRGRGDLMPWLVAAGVALVARELVPGAWYVKAQKLRRWFRGEAMRVFAGVDAIIAPATPCRAPRLGQKTFVLDGQELPVRPNLGLFTQPISFIGLPVCTVPVWTEGEALPIGVQVIAAPWREDIVLRVAAALERDGVVEARVA